MMKYFETLFYSLFPKTHLKGTPWVLEWNEIERQNFLKNIRIFFYITLIGYMLHYHTVDVAEGLAPSKLWFRYRYGMSLVSLICLILYSFPNKFIQGKGFRIPAILSIAAFCYLQARTCIWYDKVPYLYVFVFVIAGIAVLGMSPLKSFALSAIIFISVYSTLLEAGVSEAMIFSGFFASFSVIIFTRLKYITDIKYFIATQRNIEQKKQFIEMNMEFTDHIKSFLPREIAGRLTNCIQKNRMGVSHAIHEVLSPRKKYVSCIFSDIRGFTKSSNDLQGFVSEAMFPEVTACNEVIEKFGGIPRKIGDLIFAYFDNGDQIETIDTALRSALMISRVNNEFNQNFNGKYELKRYILVSTGEAVVGNLSSYSSSIEITAIGSPVNLLSRLDDITKHKKIADQLISGDIIFCPDLHDYFKKISINGHLFEIPIHQNNLKIRDFEEIEKIYVFRLNFKQQHIEAAS